MAERLGSMWRKRTKNVHDDHPPKDYGGGDFFYPLPPQHNHHRKTCGYDEETDNDVITDHSSVSYQETDERSIVSSAAPPTNETKLVVLDTLRAFDTFSMPIGRLPILRQTPRDVDLGEMDDFVYLTQGSHSHIFTASWHGKPVIVKMLQDDKVQHPMAQYEFAVETELLARMCHDRIIQTVGSGNIPRPFIVLERLVDLSVLLHMNTPPSLNSSLSSSPHTGDANGMAEAFNDAGLLGRGLTFLEVLRLARDLADALGYCHHGLHPEGMIIHRDLKPENMGVTKDKRLKLYDFGLCRFVKRRAFEMESYKMTGQTGAIRYMAPEVIRCQPYNEKVDVYSFGLVVWSMAKGKVPFKGFDKDMHRARVVDGGERPKMDASWPRGFSALLQACWHDDALKRPAFPVVASVLGRLMEDLQRPTTMSTSMPLTKGMTTPANTTQGLSLFRRMSDAFAVPSEKSSISTSSSTSASPAPTSSSSSSSSSSSTSSSSASTTGRKRAIDESPGRKSFLSGPFL